MGEHWLLILLSVGVSIGLILVIRSMTANRVRGRAGSPSRGGHVDRDVRRAVKQRQQAGDAVGAADLLFRSGSYEAAADLYAKTDHPRQAAESFERAGKAAMAIQAYKRAGLREEAARLSLENGMFLIAGKEYEELGQFARAAECYLKGDDSQKAAECYTKSEHFRDAGLLWIKLGQKPQAAEAFTRHFQAQLELAKGDVTAIREPRQLAQKAARLFLEVGRDADAANLLRQAAFHEDAGKVLLKMGNLREAAESFVKAGRPDHAARIYERLGDKENSVRFQAQAHLLSGNPVAAADRLSAVGDHATAARLYEEAGELVKAAEGYHLAGELVAAADLYTRQSQLEPAVALYREAGEPERAARLLMSLGRLEEAAVVWAEAGNSLEAGVSLFKVGKREEALKHLGKVTDSTDQGRRARALEGRILYQLGRGDEAERKFVQAIDSREPSIETIDYFYKAGRCAESAGSAESAVKYYESVIGVDPAFGDAQARIQALRTRGRGPAPTMGQPQSFQGSMNWPTGSYKAIGSSSQPARGGGEWPVMSRYHLIDEIARGGMGVVYRAQDTVLERIVAFKVLSQSLKSNQTAVEYFIREARAAARLSHPNIVTIYDAGEEAGEYYMAMEYVEGETLKTLIKRQGAFPERLLRYITVHACRGLAYAHDKGLVHRDIKSGNLMLTKDKIVKIMDFGLAKFVEEAQREHTKKIGTPYYMSPEQILGKELDRRSDIYSLGITLFECATGKVPFAKGDLSYHHLHTPPPYAKDLGEHLSDRMNHLIARCIQKLPEDRFQNAEEILEELKE